METIMVFVIPPEISSGVVEGLIFVTIVSFKVKEGVYRWLNGLF